MTGIVVVLDSRRPKPEPDRVCVRCLIKSVEAAASAMTGRLLVDGPPVVALLEQVAAVLHRACAIRDPDVKP